MKNIASDASEFEGNAAKMFQMPDSDKERVTSVRAGPAKLLGLDNFLTKILEDLVQAKQLSGLTKGILDRSYVADVHLGGSVSGSNHFSLVLSLVSVLVFRLQGVLTSTGSGSNESVQSSVLPYFLRFFNAVSKVAGEQQAQKQSDFMNGISFAASKPGTKYVGHLPLPLPTLTYQFQGNRLVAFVNVMDLLELIVSDECGKFGDTVTSDKAPAMLQDGFHSALSVSLLFIL